MTCIMYCISIICVPGRVWGEIGEDGEWRRGVELSEWLRPTAVKHFPFRRSDASRPHQKCCCKAELPWRALIEELELVQIMPKFA